MAIDHAWISSHNAVEGQVLPPGASARPHAVSDLTQQLSDWASSFARERFDAPALLSMGRRGLHPDEAASFLRAVETDDVVVDECGRFQVKCARQKAGGWSTYNLFSASSLDDEPIVSLNTEYLIQAGTTSELVRHHGWDPSDIEFEVGEFDARGSVDGTVVLLAEAKARVEGVDGLASLLRSFIDYAAGDPPTPDSNHSRKYVELLTTADDGPVVVWLVAAGARWAFDATRQGDAIVLDEITGVSRGTVAKIERSDPSSDDRDRAPSTDHAAAVAAFTDRDTRARCYEWDWSSEVEVRDFIDALRPLLEINGLAHARPWVWRVETSGGHPTTPCGADTGLELRFAYNAGNT